MKKQRKKYVRTDYILNDFDKAEIERLYKKGMRLSSIPVFLGLSYGQVKSYIYKNLDISRYTRWTMKDLKEIQRLYVEEKKTCTEIADMYGVHYNCLSIVMKKNNMSFRELKELRR